MAAARRHRRRVAIERGGARHLDIFVVLGALEQILRVQRAQATQLILRVLVPGARGVDDETNDVGVERGSARGLNNGALQTLASLGLLTNGNSARRIK
jgi:hypothetical protein